MNQLSSVAAIYEQMDRAKRTGPLLTNFFATPDKLQRWVQRGARSMTVGDVVLVLHRDRDLFHLSYMASGPAELARALEHLVATTRETIAVDILGKRDQVDGVADVFAAAGFQRHRTLVRMVMSRAPGAHEPPDARRGDPAPVGSPSLASHGPASEPSSSGPEVELAEAGDGPALARMLEDALDRHSEQIPDADEMTAAAANRQVLILRSGAELAGMLFYEVTGQSSLLRHWLVDARHRDRRVGARLMRRYFADCAGVRRFVLWVISDNDNAIDRYRHYGYQTDGVIDQVLLWRPL